MAVSDLDPRWEWTEARRLCDPEPRYIRGPCRHLSEYVVPVESGGEIVAALCTTCDAQLPAAWSSPLAAPTRAEIQEGID